ncbi:MULTISPECIES: SMP-30/gluconolactonase/LRE family protein [unclassified Psychrobacter]|uniref:SMP-30/gluconolactonase/LRE family protein n=1 Tax=unclassified Psychrobacter TaxID=196806 RepID=UPI003FD545A8
MSNYELNVVVDDFHYLEGPRWYQDALWFVDFYTKGVYRINDAGDAEKIVHVEEQPSGLGWLPDGRMLVVSMKDRKILRLEDDGELVVHADISKHCGGHANDMVVALNGNAYIGDFGFDLTGGEDFKETGLVLVRPDGSSQVVAEGLCFPNGMVISADEKTLIVNEMFGNRISQFEVYDDGTLGPRRDFANFGELGDEPDLSKRVERAQILPDGLTLDQEGAVWIADTLNHRVARIKEGGEILEVVETAPEGIFAVMLGGADGKTLFMCAALDWNEESRKAETKGRMLSTRVAVAHDGTP